MTINRALSSAAIVACVAGALASPALADPPGQGATFEGTYAYFGPVVFNGPPIANTWSATSCGWGCARIVVQSVPDQAGFTAQAELAYGGWVMALHDVQDVLVSRRQPTCRRRHLQMVWNGRHCKFFGARGDASPKLSY